MTGFDMLAAAIEQGLQNHLEHGYPLPPVLRKPAGPTAIWRLDPEPEEIRVMALSDAVTEVRVVYPPSVPQVPARVFHVTVAEPANNPVRTALDGVDAAQGAPGTFGLGPARELAALRDLADAVRQVRGGGSRGVPGAPVRDEARPGRPSGDDPT